MARTDSVYGKQESHSDPAIQDQQSSTAFRVCINADERTKFLDTEKWVQHIIIRGWEFKKKEDKRKGDTNEANSKPVVAVDNKSSDEFDAQMIDSTVTEENIRPSEESQTSSHHGSGRIQYLTTIGFE